jgi:hypothetical protein
VSPKSWGEAIEVKDENDLRARLKQWHSEGRSPSPAMEEAANVTDA